MSNYRRIGQEKQLGSAGSLPLRPRTRLWLTVASYATQQMLRKDKIHS